MRFQEQYDIPADLVEGAHSPAFEEFLRLWFVDSTGLIRREVDLGFLSELRPDELEIAKNLLRRNLALKYNHIIEGLAALHDVESVPALRAMLAKEDDASRQLTISGSLWKLVRDESFVEYLKRMKESKNVALKRAHIRQILWLKDQRAIELLIDMLDDDDEFVRFRALKILNELEFGRSFLAVPEAELPGQPIAYKRRREDTHLREVMVGNIARLT